MRFTVFNLAALALLVCAWLMGLFQPFASIGSQEWTMLVALMAYGVVGAVLLVRGHTDAASHVANSLPIFGLCFTGLGLLLGAYGFTSLDPSSLAQIFRNLVAAISPNVVAVALMLWLREMGMWLYRASL